MTYGVRIFLGAILLLFFQVTVLINMRLGEIALAFPYLMILLALPFTLAREWVLVAAFFLGLSVDIFFATLGLHTTACLVLALARPGILRLLAPRDSYEATQNPSPFDMGWQWYLVYAGLLSAVHLLVLFTVENFAFQGFGYALLKALASIFYTLFWIVLLQFLVGRRSR